MSRPKYALPEIERRWLVERELARPLLNGRSVKITDTYLTNTRLRLRRVVDAEGTTVFKLCRKYGDRQGPVESITNLYLDAAEYALLTGLPGDRVVKQRYRQGAGSIDVYGQNALHVFEIEFAAVNLALRYKPPAFVGQEITDDPNYSGLMLARQFR